MVKNHKNDNTAFSSENINKKTKTRQKSTSDIEALVFCKQKKAFKRDNLKNDNIEIQNNLDNNDKDSKAIDAKNTSVDNFATKDTSANYNQDILKENFDSATLSNSKEEDKLDDEAKDEALDKLLNTEKSKPNSKKRKHKKKSIKQKTTLSHKLKVLSVLTVLGIFTGSGLGVWYFNTNLKSPDYSSLSAENYIKPISQVLSENFNISSDKQENWLDYVGNATPDTLSHVDNVLLSIHNASLADNYLFTGNGKAVSMGIAQTIYSQRRHIDDIYTFESISTGTISVANLDIYKNDKKNGNEIKLYTGKKISQRNADWYYNKTISTDEYQNMTGGLPDKVTPYIISEKTVTSSTMTKDDNGNYVITFILDPMTSVLNYYKEVRRTGGLEADPQFNSVKLIATIDSKWNLITTEVFEVYKAVKFGMGVPCNGNVKIEYNFNLPEVLLPEIKG